MIITRELQKSFGSLVAVDRVSFSVAPGEVLGFLGPNGAGKSTTMKMIAGFLAPSSPARPRCAATTWWQPGRRSVASATCPKARPATAR
jgi:ABC-2 type transport system ATP-binding protein